MLTLLFSIFLARAFILDAGQSDDLVVARKYASCSKSISASTSTDAGGGLVNAGAKAAPALAIDKRPVAESVSVPCAAASANHVDPKVATQIPTLVESIIQKIDSVEHELHGTRALLDMMWRGRAFYIITSSIDAFADRVMLAPLGIGFYDRRFLFKKLRTDAVTRATVSHLMSTSGVDMSLDQFLKFRREIYQSPFRSSHSGGMSITYYSPSDFEEALRTVCERVPNLTDEDRDALVRLHIHEVALDKASNEY